MPDDDEKMKRYAFMERPSEVERWRAMAEREGGDLSSYIRRVMREATREAEIKARGSDRNQER